MPFPPLDAGQVYAVHSAALAYTVRIQTASDDKAQREDTKLVVSGWVHVAVTVFVGTACFDLLLSISGGLSWFGH
jgi:hypothetical protein